MNSHLPIRNFSRSSDQTHEVKTSFVRAFLALLSLGVILSCLQGCGNPKAMDVLWSSDLVDDNGLARNPVWSEAKQSGQPPNPCNFCPCDNEDPNAWKSAANCTDQTLATNSSLECFGHWNWFPITYEGVVTWGGHSNSWYDDDDYWMGVKRSDRALETCSCSAETNLHIEFDSEETVDYWDDTNTWWDDFHHNYVDDNDQAAENRINGKDVIVIGLLGLDSQHGVPSELNPVYAMFVHVQDDPANDCWAFFVKNWGNEGFCGDDEQYLDMVRQNTVKIRIRHPGASTFALTQNVQVYGDDEDEANQQSWTFQPVPDGALLTFHLRDPDKQVGFVGDLAFDWSGKGTPILCTGDDSKSRVSTLPPPRTFTADKDGDMKLRARIQRLSLEDQQALFTGVQQLRQYPHCAVKQGILASSTVEKPAKPTGSIPKYSSLVRSAKDPARLSRKAKAREFVLSFLKAHGIE